MSPPVFDAADARFEVGGFEPQYLVIYADYSHWWQRIWARLTRRMVLWAGPVLPPDAIGVLDLDADTIKVVWDNSFGGCSLSTASCPTQHTDNSMMTSS